MARSSFFKAAFGASLVITLLVATSRVGAALTRATGDNPVDSMHWLRCHGDVLPACCDGIRALNASWKTTEDSRFQCNGVKERAALIPGLDYHRVNTLPGKC